MPRRAATAASAAVFLISAIVIWLAVGALAPDTRAQASFGRDQALIVATKRGEVAEVRRLLREGARIGARDKNGRTPLMSATRRNDVDLARLLIQEGADVNAKDLIQDTPFLYAGAEGLIDILKLTLAAGADVASTNRFGGTALIPACHHGHVETVKVLLSTDIDVDHVNNFGWTALMEAVILADGGPTHAEIVRLLVAARANVNIPDRDGVTPLGHARSRGYSDIVRIIAVAGGR
jgi:ankyrin repeat protein